MIQKLREILLTQYIGAILVALLIWQAVIEVILALVRIGFWCFNHFHPESVYGVARTPFPWDNIVFAAVAVVLYLVTAYGLAQWLYPSAASIGQPGAEDGPSTDQVEPS